MTVSKVYQGYLDKLEGLQDGTIRLSDLPDIFKTADARQISDISEPSLEDFQEDLEI